MFLDRTAFLILYFKKSKAVMDRKVFKIKSKPLLQMRNVKPHENMDSPMLFSSVP